MSFCQEKTPLVDALLSFTAKPHAPFYVPGHKRGTGISPLLTNLLGEKIFRADVTELPELDNLFAPEGVIKEAQELAAAAFGATATWFLFNGSTCGIIAAILATCKANEKIILPRNVHQSAIAGLILSGATPIFLPPQYHSQWDIASSISTAAVAAALEQHPDAKAVLLVYPTYEGVCGDLKAIAQLVHRYHIPLLVDEAHGAHFAFHPHLPPSALSLGADLAVQSTHKVLGAMTQASMLHLQGNRIEPELISKALKLIESSSPSYILLASLDAARQQAALQGEELMEKALNLAELGRTGLSSIEGLSLFEPARCKGYDGMAFDQTRLTVNVTKLGLSGFEADEILHQKLGVMAELPTLQNLTFIITFGNTITDIEQLIEGFTILARDYRKPSLSFSPLSIPPTSNLVVSPREAFFARTETVALEEAVDRISGEIICPYPPGIPLLMPGEAISSASLAYLQQVLALGSQISIQGCSDSTLKTLKVLLSP